MHRGQAGKTEAVKPGHHVGRDNLPAEGAEQTPAEDLAASYVLSSAVAQTEVQGLEAVDQRNSIPIDQFARKYDG